MPKKTKQVDFVDKNNDLPLISSESKSIENTEISYGPLQEITKESLLHIGFPTFTYETETGEEKELNIQAIVEEFVEDQSRKGGFTNKKNKK